MTVFNLDYQNNNLDNKIVAGLERLSQVFRVLLWEKAKEFGVSPIQIQLMIFIHHHSQDKSTITYLAQEFNLTKPTISDAVKILEKKQLLNKIVDSNDKRSYTIQLTTEGQNIVFETENYANPLTGIIAKSNESDKSILWHTISNLILQLNKLEIINVQRTCYNCKHYLFANEAHFCKLIDQKLQSQDIRIDCKEFEVV